MCLILTNIDGMVTKYALRFDFKASNNQVEYEILIAKFKIAKDLSVKHLWYLPTRNSLLDSPKVNMRLEILFSLNIYKDLSLCDHILLTSKFSTSLTLRMPEPTLYHISPLLVM